MVGGLRSNSNDVVNEFLKLSMKVDTVWCKLYIYIVYVCFFVSSHQIIRDTMTLSTSVDEETTAVTTSNTNVF